MAGERKLIDVYRLVIDLARANKCGRMEHDDVLAVIASQKTVEVVEVVHGRWEDEYGGAFSNPRYRCSTCKEKALYRHEQNSLGGWEAVQALTEHCPHCGAVMYGYKVRKRMWYI